MKKNLFILIIAVCAIVHIFSGVCESVLAASMPELLLIKCNGEMKTLSGAHYEKVSGQTLLGDIQRGYLFKNDFFYIDNNSLKYIDIVSRKTFTISNLEMEVGTDQLPRQIGYVDDRVVYFSTIEYGKNLPVNKQLSHAVISKVMRQTEKIEKLNIRMR